jgi:hypothetical protein
MHTYTYAHTYTHTCVPGTQPIWSKMRQVLYTAHIHMFTFQNTAKTRMV